MIPTRRERNALQNKAKPRKLPFDLECKVKDGKGGLWAAERSLRQAFIQNQNHPWETVGTVHDWIMSQRNPLRVCDRVGILVLEWMICSEIDDQNRAIAALISDRIDDWRQVIIERNIRTYNNGTSCR